MFTAQGGVHIGHLFPSAISVVSVLAFVAGLATTFSYLRYGQRKRSGDATAMGGSYAIATLLAGISGLLVVNHHEVGRNGLGSIAVLAIIAAVLLFWATCDAAYYGEWLTASAHLFMMLAFTDLACVAGAYSPAGDSGARQVFLGASHFLHIASLITFGVLAYLALQGRGRRWHG